MIRPLTPRWRIALRIWPRAAAAYEAIEWVSAASYAAKKTVQATPSNIKSTTGKSQRQRLSNFIRTPSTLCMQQL